MVIQSKSSTDQPGNVLVMMMIFAAIVSISLVGVLRWADQSNRMTIRSKAWNAALPLAEAGVEEALAHLAYTNDILSSGWQMSKGRISKSRRLGSDFYVASINTNNTALDIISKGFVQLPQTSTQYVTRTIRVGVTNEPLFNAALTVKEVLSLDGKNLSTDSFDSEKPLYSMAGLYDPSRKKEGGHVFSVAGISNTKPTLGSGKIYGRLKTGVSGLIELGTSGAVGNQSWHSAGNTGIQPGWATNDMRNTFPEFKVPKGALPASGGSVNGVDYQYVLPAGDWVVDSVGGSVYVSGQASLTVNGNFFVSSGKDSLVIAPGASLKVFMLGNNAIFWGSKNISSLSNLTHKAENFQFYGMNQNMTIATTPDITGLFYAPNAYLYLGSYGGGAGSTDVKGALVVRTLQLKGDVSIHFDEAARKIPSPILKLASWEELSPDQTPISFNDLQP